MKIVQVRFSQGFGDIVLRDAELLSEYPALDKARVRLLDTGACIHVSRMSIIRVEP